MKITWIHTKRTMEAATFVLAIIGGVFAYLELKHLDRNVELNTQQLAAAERASAVAVWGQFLTRYDDDKLRDSRVTLQRYYERLKARCLSEGGKCEGKDLDDYVSDKTRELFLVYVYRKAAAAKKEEFSEDFINEVDRSRRRIKTFFESVAFFYAHDYTKADDIKDRWGPNTVRFLREVWQPIEHGQDRALRGEESHRSTDILNKLEAINAGKRPPARKALECADPMPPTGY